MSKLFRAQICLKLLIEVRALIVSDWYIHFWPPISAHIQTTASIKKKMDAPEVVEVVHDPPVIETLALSPDAHYTRD